MLKLDDLLKINKTLTKYNRRVTPRFYYIIASIIALILLAILWDRLAPASFVTSVYWEGVL